MYRGRMPNLQARGSHVAERMCQYANEEEKVARQGRVVSEIQALNQVLDSHFRTKKCDETSDHSTLKTLLALVAIWLIICQMRQHKMI